MSRHPSSVHSIADAAPATPVRRSCRAAATAKRSSCHPQRRSSRAAAAAANQAMKELSIELCTDDQDVKGNSRNDSGSDYKTDHGSGSGSSEEEVSYTDSVMKADRPLAAEADKADITSPQHTPLQQCKRPASSIDWLACKKAKKPVQSVTKASSGAAAPQGLADNAGPRELTVPLEDLLPADEATDSQVDAGPWAEPQAKHCSHQTLPISAATMLAPPPPSSAAAAVTAGAMGSEARAASPGHTGAAVNVVIAGAMGLQPPPAMETAAATLSTDVANAAGKAEDEIAGDDHTTAGADQLQGEAAPELGSGWAEAPGKGRKLNLNCTAAGTPTSRTIYLPRQLIKQMTGPEGLPKRLKLHTTLFKDGHQLGPILECTVHQPGKIVFKANTVVSVLDCTITKLRAKKPNLFEVYVITDTSHLPASLMSDSPAPAAAPRSANDGQPAIIISSEQAPAALGPTQTLVTRRQEAATDGAAAAATAPVLRHEESGRHLLSPDTMPHSDPIQAVAAAAATGDNIAPATAVLSQEPAAAPHNPAQLASTSTVAATPVSTVSAAPEGAHLPGDYNMAPYKTIPQAVTELIPLLGFMKAPKAVRCQFRAVFAALKQLQEGDHEIEMFKADYTLLAWLVEHKDVEEVWSASGELLRTTTRVAGAPALA